MEFGWSRPPRIVGHRGNPAEAPENTMGSFLQAVDAGAAAVELDVRMSADGVLVVHHDATLGRVFPGEEAIEDLPWDALSGLRAEGGEKIPTLRDVLTRLPAGLLVNAEVKPDAANAEAVPAALDALVAACGARGRVLVTSFAPELADAYAQRAGAPAGAILPFPPEAEDLAAWPRLEWIMLAQDAATPEVIALLTAHGRRVGVWTVNEPDAARALLDAGVSCVITDRPRTLGPLA